MSPIPYLLTVWKVYEDGQIVSRSYTFWDLGGAEAAMTFHQRAGFSATLDVAPF